MNEQIFKVLYRVITPIHIGTGIDLTSFDYVIKDNFFFRIESDEIIANLNQDEVEKFYSFIEQNNLTSLRNIIVEKFDEKSHVKYKLGVTSNVSAKYQ